MVGLYSAYFKALFMDTEEIKENICDHHDWTSNNQ